MVALPLLSLLSMDVSNCFGSESKLQHPTAVKLLSVILLDLFYESCAYLFLWPKVITGIGKTYSSLYGEHVLRREVLDWDNKFIFFDLCHSFQLSYFTVGELFLMVQMFWIAVSLFWSNEHIIFFLSLNNCILPHPYPTAEYKIFILWV